MGWFWDSLSSFFFCQVPKASTRSVVRQCERGMGYIASGVINSPGVQVPERHDSRFARLDFERGVDSPPPDLDIGLAPVRLGLGDSNCGGHDHHIGLDTK